jgi:hypothetical protein
MALPLGTDIEDLGQGASGGTRLGRTSAELIGFFGLATCVSQVAMSANAAVVTTAVINSSISSSCFGYTSAQATAIITLVNALRAAGVTYGLWST